jgi:molybdopterin-biosynthesis enzyme MoeA-like protein
VFTSGGIGCTLDDKTYAGVAHAFDRDLELHTPTFEKMESWFQQKGHAENPVRARMATFPSRSRVVTLDGLWVPLVVTENVHTYPGVPYLFERMLAGAASEYVSQVGPKTRRLVFTQKTEEEIAAVLDAAQLEFRGEVNLGSYPQFHLGKGQNAPYRVMLTFEADDADECNACAQWVSERVNGFSLPEDVLKQVPGIDMFT